MKVTPRHAQRLAIPAALKGLRGRNKRALVVLATGLGKTIAAAFIAKKFGAKRLLFLVHNNFILKHAVDEFRLVFDEKTTIAIFNGLSKKGVASSDFVFATWQTMSKNLKLWKRNHFDLIIVDEAHHTEANTYRPVVDYFIGSRLGITATPNREKGDIRDVFGSEVIDISLEEAIARGWLPRIEYHVVTDESLDEEALEKIALEIKASKRRFTMAEVNRRVFIHKRDEEIGRIIGGYNEKTIVFCANIKHAERMKRSLKLSAVFHSSAGNTDLTTWRINQATLHALKNGIVRRVCTVNAFNEGVDVPSVGLVAFCRVTGSLTIFRQQLGRGLRPGKDKLIVLDFVGNLERIQLVLQMMKKISELHECYTNQREREREGYTRGNFELSGSGFEFTFSDKVVDLMKVFESCEIYSTWQEASSAVKKFGLTTQREYYEGYYLDPKLRHNPERVYPDWPGWTTFLGKEERIEPYSTWQQAAKAARRLGIKGQKDYAKHYKEDPRLPASPYTYPGFPGLRTFLTGKAKEELYPIWREASKASKRLGFKTAQEYRDGHTRDTRLPSTPSEKYPDFPGWLMFIRGKTKKEFYPSWQKARVAALKLRIRTQLQYQKLYRKDPKLPSNPQRMYKGSFPGYTEFLK